MRSLEPQDRILTPSMGELLVLRCRCCFLCLLRSRSCTRLSLYHALVHGYRLFLAKRRSLRNEVEVGRLALGAALARFQTSRIQLGTEFIRRQVVLDVDRALCAQLLGVDHFRLVGESYDGHSAVRHLLDAKCKFVEHVLAVVVHTPRFLGVLLEGTL